MDQKLITGNNMNNKKLSIKILNFEEELDFFRKYYKYLLAHCIENKYHYNGQIAVEIIKFNEKIEELLEKPDKTLKNEDINFLIKIAEGRYFKELNELSLKFNKNNSHDILKNPRYKMFHVLEFHGY